ncbi:MAG: hypothetical protein R3F59_03490 [Myxococcota bacterium]
MRSYGWMTLAAIACTGDGGDPKDTGVDTQTSDSGTSDTDTPITDEPTECASDFTTHVAQDGAPVASTELRLCRGLLCRNGATDAQGDAVFENVPPEWHSYEVVAPEASGRATALVPLLFDCATDRQVDVPVLDLDAPSPLAAAPAEHPTGDGLYVTVGLDQLEPPTFFDPAESVAGVRVPEALWFPFDGVTGTVLAVWYLAPFDYHAIPTEGLPVRIVDQWGLTDGDELELYVGSYEDSAWVSAGTVTASGGDLTGGALPLLSTLLLVQP